MSEGAAKDAWRANLIVREYTRTEEIILALCTMDDPEASYDDFRPALSPLLAEKRTLPVAENAGIYGWLVWSCFKSIKACRKKDNTVPKAIQALALGYLREDKPAYKALLGAGFEVDAFGDRTIIVRSIPVFMEKLEVAEEFGEIGGVSR